jgi:hypothetical protein
MDSKAFLGLDVWEFSVRSVRYRYGRLFVRSIVLRHPRRALKGLHSYRRLVRPARRPDHAPVGLSDQLANPATGALVVGLGYCEKPLSPACPAGRFNHRCLLMDRSGTPETSEICRTCPVGAVAQMALRASAAVYIMTSAEDIARDLLLPSLRGHCGRAVLSVCPYSVAPLTLAMAICRLHGCVFPYVQGDCRDFNAWARADVGFKEEQTSMAETVSSRFKGVLAERSRLRAEQGLGPGRRFEYQGNMYLPGP